jgi:glycosyltransferase involved in cell wall biosynthesis
MTHGAPSLPQRDLCVLLTPRAPGGHEAALLAWLADAVRDLGLRPLIVAPSVLLQQACAAAGLAPWLHPAPAQAGQGDWSRVQLLQVLARCSRQQPLLLAPGVLHADAWLLAAAVLLRRRVWVYVPMAGTAQQMHYRAGWLRDQLLAPWLGRVEAWITLDERQAALLHRCWRLAAPVHLLPNVARLPAVAPTPPAAAADGRLRVAWVGRFDLHQKGLDWLIGLLRSDPAWARLVSWSFQGRGPGEAALQALAQALGPQRVQVHAHAPIDRALARSDVLLLASRYEGQPLVALEATARGWPVVATSASGVASLLPAASIFEFGDAAGLQRALEHLRAPAARQAAVAHAQRRLRTLHSEQRRAGALQTLVQALRGPPAPYGL